MRKKKGGLWIESWLLCRNGSLIPNNSAEILPIAYELELDFEKNAEKNPI